MDPRIACVIELVAKEEAFRMTAEDLSSIVRLSPSRLRHLFRAETGISLRRYIRNHQFEITQHLLITTFMSVKEIAARTGFDDAHSFEREFKRRYGVTPSRYRASRSERP